MPTRREKNFNKALAKAGLTLDESLPPPYIAAVRKILAEHGAIAIARLRRIAASIGGDRVPPISASALFNRTRLAEDLGIATRPLSKRAVEMIAGPSLRAVGIRFDLADPLLEGVFAQIPNRTNIADTTWKQIQGSLEKTYIEGASIPEATAALQRSVVDLGRGRAVTIARTELLMLKNASSDASAGIAGMNFKSWVTAGDGRVRETHALAAGQVVPVRSKFQVGGSLLRYPGDPQGPAAEVINCRCVNAYGDESGSTRDLATEARRGIRETPGDNARGIRR